ncbi:hypothetical protein EZI54_11430 [Marinobacter halodurans]|uniref:Type 4 fimbrial biogenesis protein PilX N-terminal domain-containing protein n=1 Tax=Marinobacter halodurans TaxID=2528979 RepID=A0ABY1ZJP5_9GAMM|nr:hypothetical protein [Marinobacter halodurans]TBW55432.1 hypothetical protein EZI54_11430 [Marinobacter halodurans]
MAKCKKTIVTPGRGLHRQRGIAALLLVLLTGLSATVVAMGTMSYVRGSQKSQMTVHAQTQSEIYAWAGVQALTAYLNNNLSADPDTSLDAFLNGLGNLKFSKVGSDTDIAVASYQSGCSSTSGNSTIACFNVTGSSADSHTPLQVAYRITQNNPPTPEVITTPLVFNGDLSIAGGGLDVTGNSDYRNIAVNGDIIMQSAATSDISGCATGDITINGGGIPDHGHLYSSGGDVTVDGQDASDMSIWGDNVTINGGGGSYQAIKANGDITINNAGIGTVDFMHANNITVSPGGRFTEVKVNHDFHLGNGADEMRQFGTLTGGHDFIVSSKSHIPLFDQPSTIAGQVRVEGNGNGKGRGKGDKGAVVSEPIPHLSVKQQHVHPGLAGFPECHVEVTAFDVNNLIAQANYIFYFDKTSGDPMLKIQNVNDSDGKSIDQTINLRETDVRTLDGHDFLQCNWWYTGDWCGHWASADDGWTFTGLFALPRGIIVFGGTGDPDQKNLTATRFTLNGVSGARASPLYGSPLYNTLLSTGDLNLTAAGGLFALTAPNFAKAADICNQDFYPRQLCEKGGGDRYKLAMTKDGDGNTVPKFPLANNAVMTNQDFSTNSWTISGHVIVGDDIDTAAGTTQITGALSVGLNVNQESGEQGSTEISAGGLIVDTSKLTAGQLRTFTGGKGGGGKPERVLAGYRARSL